MADRTTIDAQIDTDLVDRTGNPNKLTGPELNALMKLITANYPNIDGLPAGSIPQISGTGEAGTSNLRQNQTTGNIEATAPATFTPAINIGSTQLAVTGNIVRLMRSTDVFLPIGVAVTTSGTGEPIVAKLGAFGDLPAGANQTATDTTEDLAPGASMSFMVPVASGVNHVTSQVDVQTSSTGTLRLRIYSGTSADPDNLFVDETIAVSTGTTTANFTGWGLFEAGESVFVVFENTGTTTVTIRGTGTGASFRPYSLNRGYPYSVVTLESEMPNVRTDEQFQDAVAAMLTGGTHNGISITYDDTNGVINFDVTGTQPPVSTPNISSFSINIPSVISTGTNINDSRTIQFTTTGTSQISTMDLVVTTGDDVTLIVPSSDGSHSQSVTLSNIETANPTTVTFQIRATTSGGQTITSNVQTVTVRTQTADEFAYYGTSATNNAATIDTATLTSVDVQQPGTTYDINTTLNANEFLIILEPSDRAITAITELTFNVDALSRFTRTTNVRTINGQQYDTYVLQNNGPTGSVSFRVTHS